ncbi:pentatricopeptide repeat-containing protein At3g02650, mitochondrial [Asparagus officinalis]|uniref:pentatricopeptide repeat-containing protein At3g02650, mitochondrial n=1 Tax=Asparagus officinalis TaxID=4686 RepID=UPI00098E6AFB|nr:pentatricopeptide repeat-containing protein At3g02650, mitochondrial [Asparagus officinalis]XP_020248660.1 pentatricopeptide repeat-containing protein At3g02650, mitochondrial [Asparagus officinalis]
MWRSKARSLLLRSLHSHTRSQSQAPRKTLALSPIPRPHLLPSRLIRNPSFFSSQHDASSPSDEAPDPGEASSWTPEEPEGSNGTPPWDLEDHDDKGAAFGEITQEPADSSPLEVEGDGDGAQVATAEISPELIKSVVSILKGGEEEAIESSLDKLEPTLSEEFVVKVIEASDGVGGKNLIGFYKRALEMEESVKTSRAMELLVLSVKSSPELGKKEAYMLWDLVKELGKEIGVLSTEMLNELISIFWQLGKAKAGFEVFNKFNEFGCSHDADSYYYTIQALGKRSMFDSAWSVCEKMLSCGNLPNREKIGEIITFFCKGKKAKEAHLVYLMAKEKNLSPPRSSLDFLICGLARNDGTVSLAFELLEDYPKGSFKYANKTYGAVVKSLCRVKKTLEAKSLLLKMVESGPAPGNASFNYVINALSKGGELEDALALMKVMESRGLRPDVYTYTVVMSGYAKGGLMDEAYRIFCEAKKRHGKLSPATYHVLTRGYCKMEEFDKALEIMKEMKVNGVQPNADEYNKMIQSLCLKALDWRSAENLLEEMKESGMYLKGATRSLVAAVREIEEEETQPEEVSIEA